MKIATYNIENLFDLKHDGGEYEEFVPYAASQWNDKTYRAKLKNISRVINDIGADIVALQEVESAQALRDLKDQIKREGIYYQYFAIADRKNTTIKVALLSRIPFVYAKELVVGSNLAHRNILEVKFNVEGESFYLFINHWKAKSGPESERIYSAKILRKRIEALGWDKNIILVGDFNSHYEEHKLFVKKREHNDTNGKTGINHVLRTLDYTGKTDGNSHAKESLYNLWYDLDEEHRYSYIFKGKKEALDSIIVSQSLIDREGMFYIKNSLESFKAPYLFKGKGVYRWQQAKRAPHEHRGKGFSDHLPVVAEFLVK